MNLAIELRPTYGSMVNTYVNLGTIFADAPIEIRAQAQQAVRPGIFFWNQSTLDSEMKGSLDLF